MLRKSCFFISTFFSRRKKNTWVLLWHISIYLQSLLWDQCLLSTVSSVWWCRCGGWVWRLRWCGLKMLNMCHRSAGPSPAPAQPQPQPQHQPQPSTSSHCHNYPPDGHHHPSSDPTCTVTRAPPPHTMDSRYQTLSPVFTRLSFLRVIWRGEGRYYCSDLKENTVLSFPCSRPSFN